MPEIFSQKRKILSRYERQKALVAALRSERNPERKKIKEEISKLLALEIRLGIPCSGEFSSAVSIDEDLEQKIAAVISLRRRSCIADLEDFVREKHVDTLFALYGVRRTGKTTMLLQSIADMPAEERKKCAYILADADDTFASLAIDLLNLQRLGKKYIFIDEATALGNFPDESSKFADIHARDGLTIVLSGTDSLKIKLAMRSGLLGRIIETHTTRMLFSEWHAIQGKPLKKYIHSGGILSGKNSERDPSPFETPAGTKGYILSSICGNITHSMDDWEEGADYEDLQEMRDAGELQNGIQKIIADDSHAFTVKAFRKSLSTGDLGLALKNLGRKSPDWDVVERLLDKESIRKEYLRLLGVKPDADLKVPVGPKQIEAMRRYFFDLDLLLPSGTFMIGEGRKKERNLLVLPGLRWNQSETLIRALLSDASATEILSPSQFSDVVTAIRHAVEGRLLEEIVMRDLMIALDLENRWDEEQILSARRNADGAEIDIIVRNLVSGQSLFFEIKNSDTSSPDQAKWLNHADFMEKLTSCMGEPLAKCVIYNGDDKEEEDDVLWRNAEKFLSRLVPAMRMEDVAELLFEDCRISPSFKAGL